MWQAGYGEDLMNIDPSYPSNEPVFVGAGFQHQVSSGRTFSDINDDRVTFIGDAMDPTVMYHRSQSLEGDLDSTGFGAAHGGVVFPGGFSQSPSTVTPAGNIPTDTTQPGGEIVQSEETGLWYDTLRPNAGYQLPSWQSDEVYAAVTGDTISQPYGVTDPLLVEIGERLLDPSPLASVVTMFNDGSTQVRLSREPSTPQAFYNLWDTALGAENWDGRKAAMNRPVADPGPWFEQAIVGGIPSPTGAGGSMVANNSFELAAEPMTFRAPPEPWDTGPNNANGRFVNGGP